MRKPHVILLAAGLAAAACAPSAGRPAASGNVPIATTAPVAAARSVDVYKSPTCSCCHEWEAYMRAHGWTVRSLPTQDMAAVKTRLGIPEAAWSCHTAVIGDYAVEGHVPIEAIEDMLEQRPAIDGIALPGMPPGSPGMPGERPATLLVLAVAAGSTESFGGY